MYLTQGKQHSSYGQSMVEQLKKSVGLLYKHYNKQARDDVIFLHTGDVDATMQADVLSLCGPEARFHTIAKQHFELPVGVDPTSERWLFPHKFSIGYRHSKSKGDVQPEFAFSIERALRRAAFRL